MYIKVIEVTATYDYPEELKIQMFHGDNFTYVFKLQDDFSNTMTKTGMRQPQARQYPQMTTMKL